MTPEKKQLDDLFQSVGNDTPSIDLSELRSLLDKKASGNIPTTDVQKAIITEDRRRGLYKKGIIIMTFITIATIAFFLSNQPSSAPVTSNIIPNNHGGNPTVKITEKPDGNMPSSTVLNPEKHHNQETNSKGIFPKPEVQPVPIVELNDAALLKLGIYKKASGEVYCYQNIGSKKFLFQMIFTQKPWGVSATIIDKNSNENESTIPLFAPEHISNLDGKGRMSAKGPSPEQVALLDILTRSEFQRLNEIDRQMAASPNTDPQKILSQDDLALLQKVMKLKSQLPTQHSYVPSEANDLVPILVRKNTVIAGKEQNDALILWYAPTPQVMEIVKNNANLKSKVKFNSTTLDKVTLDKVIDNISCVPNPTSSKATLHFSLKASHSLTIAIYNITGKYIKDLSKISDLIPGEYDIDIQAEGLTSGIYLLVIRTDRGEQSIQRLIIEK